MKFGVFVYWVVVGFKRDLECSRVVLVVWFVNVCGFRWKMKVFEVWFLVIDC